MRMRSIVAVAMAITLVAAGCSSDSDDPASVLEDYVAAYNSGDIDAVALFTDG